MKKILISLFISLCICGIYFVNSGIFARVYASVALAADKMVISVQDKNQLVRENAVLLSELEKEKKKLIEYANIRAENKRLRDLLSISDSCGWETEVLRVVAYGENSGYEKIVAEGGRNKGITPGQTVLYPGGFAGVVDEVGENWCTVNTLLSDKLKMSVTDTKNRKTYLLSGKTLEVSYIDGGDNVSEGDVFVASGLSGGVPEALRIGTLSMKRGNNGTVRSAEIILPEEYFDMRYLLVVTE